MNTTYWRIALALGIAAFTALAQPAVGSSHAEQVAGGKYELGFMLLVVGMGAVFLGLLAIYVFLIVLERTSRKRNPIVTQQKDGMLVQQQIEVSAEMATAIALALYMDLRTFDEGTAEEVTIRKITRPFSPWWNAAKTQVIFDKIEMFRRKY
ncbi:MAG: hypothetical protein MUF01_06595 [Bryobacterales bacterium]|jgi:Na+-transporting methylmalonyl-CoA/oxaloacetate decarboxylase gamma subunit|nr:hypothetical protein [Bryobacterales bacterium]